MSEESALVRELLSAVVRSIDEARLRDELAKLVGATPATEPRTTPAPDARTTPAHHALLERLALADILDESIVGARPADPSFPLRLFFATLGEHANDETAFALVSGLNFYFRAQLDEEARVRLGVEISKLYYAYVSEVGMDAALVTRVSPLLARLMSTELERLRLEALDQVPVFDSSLHERGPGADPTSAAVRRPQSFLVRVVGNDKVRFKALVTT